MKPKRIFLAIIAILLIIILVQNTRVINIHILFWTISMSQIILLFIVSLIAFLIGYFSHLLFSKKKRQNNSNNREIS